VTARGRDLYLKTNNTHKRQTSKPPAGFEPAIPASDRPQNSALDRAATGIGNVRILIKIIMCSTSTDIYAENKLSIYPVL
jgi:hypothetical protein